MQSDRLFGEEGRRFAERTADEAPLPAGGRIGGVQADCAGRGVAGVSGSSLYRVDNRVLCESSERSMT